MCLYYIYLFAFVCVFACMCTCHEAYVEVRGQIMGISSLLPPLSSQKESLPIQISSQPPYTSLKTYLFVFLNFRFKGPSGQPPQYGQSIKWVPKKTALKIVLGIYHRQSFVLFVLIQGAIHSGTLFKRILSINNAFKGLHVDFMYDKKVKVVFW